MRDARSRGAQSICDAYFIKDLYMKTLGKLAISMGFLSLLSVLPIAAQVNNGVAFTTASPFYVGGTKLPAGSYKITQPDMSIDLLRIESTVGTNSVFVNYIPTESSEPFGKSDVTFRLYGGTAYLDRVSIAGDTDGVMIDPTKPEEKAAANANVADRSSVSSGQ
jgi:hypothetical protein